MKMEIEYSKVEVEALFAATVESLYPSPPDYRWRADSTYSGKVAVTLEKLEDDLMPEPVAPPAVSENA